MKSLKIILVCVLMVNVHELLANDDLNPLEYCLQILDANDGTGQVDANDGTGQVNANDGTGQIDANDGTGQIDLDAALKSCLDQF